jgi:acyl-CoA synthetase (AMP-forming)/AMP-acid ligase II
VADAATEFATFADALTARAAALADKTAFVFLDERGNEQRLSFGALHDRARAVASQLRESLPADARALLLYPPGLDYVTAVYACFYARLVGVSAYPPHPRRLERTLPRLYAIAADADLDAVLTTTALRDVAAALLPDDTPLSGRPWLATDAPRGGGDGDGDAHAHRVDPRELAFLQYTSGSTAKPRGVMLSHRNLLANSAVIRRAFGLGEDSVGVIWLPPYHDMGLIGGILQPVYLGSTCLLMPPGAVVMHPLRWLEAISRYRATTSGGPDFSYELCVRRIDPAERVGLDLSSWDVAFNGAEPVRANTLRAFTDAFAPHGFRESAFSPCYGLAEATLMVTAPRAARPTLARFAKAALHCGRAVATDHSADATVLVGCGTAGAGHEVAIVDPRRRRRCEPGAVGEVWVAGPSVAAGYWRRPGETERSFAARLPEEPDAGPFLRTGDFGFEHAGELFVVGRLKDVLIVRGRNYHPADVEALAETADDRLRPHCSAAFMLGDGEPRVALVAEVRDVTDDRLTDVARAIRRAVADGLDLRLDAVALCAPGSVPKTTSGKIQRLLCRSLYTAGRLAPIAESRLDRGR